MSHLPTVHKPERLVVCPYAAAVYVFKVLSCRHADAARMRVPEL
jgi:hypothetical protein